MLWTSSQSQRMCASSSEILVVISLSLLQSLHSVGEEPSESLIEPFFKLLHHLYDLHRSMVCCSLNRRLSAIDNCLGAVK